MSVCISPKQRQACLFRVGGLGNLGYSSFTYVACIRYATWFNKTLVFLTTYITYYAEIIVRENKYALSYTL